MERLALDAAAPHDPVELAIHVDLRFKIVANVPEYDPSHPVTDQDEARLGAIYGRAPRSRHDTRTA